MYARVGKGIGDSSGAIMFGIGSASVFSGVFSGFSIIALPSKLRP